MESATILTPPSTGLSSIMFSARTELLSQDSAQHLQNYYKASEHSGQCKRTGCCYNELVVAFFPAFFRTGDGLKGKKSIPVDFIIYL